MFKVCKKTPRPTSDDVLKNGSFAAVIFFFVLIFVFLMPVDEVEKFLTILTDEIKRKLVGSTDEASSQQLQMWFSEHFSCQNFLRNLSHLLFLLRSVEQIWREEMSEKPHSIRLLR